MRMCRSAAAAPTATWWDRFKPITLQFPAATLSIMTFNWHAWVAVWEPWSARPTAAKRCDFLRPGWMKPGNDFLWAGRSQEIYDRHISLWSANIEKSVVPAVIEGEGGASPDFGFLGWFIGLP